MAKILKMPDIAERAAATTAPQDVLAEDAATFDVLRRMREDILCCVLKPDQRLRFGELRQRYDTSVGTLREALSHLVSEGLARTEAGRGFSVAPISLADFLDLSELRVYLETRTLADAIRHGTDAWEAEIVSSYFLLNKLGAAQDGRSGQRQARVGQAAQALPRFAGGDLHLAVVAAFPQRAVRPGAALPLADHDPCPLAAPERAPRPARRGAGARRRSFLHPDREAHPHHRRAGGVGSAGSYHGRRTHGEAEEGMKRRHPDRFRRGDASPRRRSRGRRPGPPIRSA